MILNIQFVLFFCRKAAEGVPFSETTREGSSRRQVMNGQVPRRTWGNVRVFATSPASRISHQLIPLNIETTPPEIEAELEVREITREGMGKVLGNIHCSPLPLWPLLTLTVPVN
mmetsp:Transcript_43082/g.131211  ORF Transcript_43082/g.131211 Transcript_43082/m.131211 type:complete len:114 (-) Transcript_43082:499-840(-)